MADEVHLLRVGRLEHAVHEVAELGRGVAHGTGRGDDVGDAVVEGVDAVAGVGEDGREGPPVLRHRLEGAVDEDHGLGVLGGGDAVPVVRAGRADAEGVGARRRRGGDGEDGDDRGEEGEQRARGTPSQQRSGQGQGRVGHDDLLVRREHPRATLLIGHRLAAGP